LLSKCAAVLGISKADFLALIPEDAVGGGGDGTGTGTGDGTDTGTGGGTGTGTESGTGTDDDASALQRLHYSYREVLRRNYTKQYGDMDAHHLEEALVEGEWVLHTTICLSIYMSINISICLSISLSVCLSP
jgi:hypothetical protein